MPCLDEAETIGRCIARAQEAIAAAGVSGEVVVADNGSRDASREIALGLGARVVDVAPKGYGSALQAGIRAARGRFVIMGDADDSYDFSRLAPFLDRLRAGDDLVMGNRFLGAIAPGAMRPLHRYLGNPVLSAIGRIFFRSPCGDFHCGMRGFRRDAVLGLHLRTTGMEFASEMVVRATLAGLRISEVPTTLAPDGRSRPPHLRSWHDGWRHLRFLLLYSPRYLFLVPGGTLMAVGVILGALILPGPRHIGAVTLDVNTLLFAAAGIIVGMQLIVFWLFARVFATTQGLHPPDRRLEWLYGRVTLETGLVLSVAALIAGLALAVASVWQWHAAGFGGLDPQRTLREVIPAALLMILGVQGFFSSFFLSILGLRREASPVPDA
ncbi:MAG: glycosyltransferase family 2 protein [Gemmatimonadales bacterium]